LRPDRLLPVVLVRLVPLVLPAGRGRLLVPVRARAAPFGARVAMLLTVTM